MGTIQLLDDIVINKIAAGEVVARPANVVKELVENSIDARSTEIHIEIAEGGQQSIQISDNGVGMHYDDCQMSLKRHATSKIADAADLFSITTMGFRGEALASIASVSRLNLCSRTEGDEGCQLASEGGEIISTQRGWGGRAHGTVIGVRDLFFNIPARAKFLRTATTEFAHCLESIQALSLANPHITITVKHNAKLRYESPAASTSCGEGEVIGEAALRQKACSLLGEDTAKNLLYIHKEGTYATFEALVSPPGYEKATSKQILTFVNRRWVKDRTIQAGIHRGYQSHLLKGRYPVVIGFLQSNPSLIDANVHPAKIEMRFQYPGEIQSLIASGIREALRHASWAQLSLGDASETSSEEPEASRRAEVRTEGSLSQKTHTPPPGLARADFLPTNPTGKTREFALPPSLASSPRIAPNRPFFGSHDLDPREQVGQASAPKVLWENMLYVGDLFQCYLLFEDREAFLAIDQHAFHERILYERLMQNPSLLATKQKLLVPEAIMLTPTQVNSLKSLQDQLKNVGFRLEFLGETTLEIHEIPTLLEGKDLARVMSDLTDVMDASSLSDKASEILTPITATIACHSAVRAGESLSKDQVTALLAEARDIDFYHNCPHGRRVFKWFTKREVENWFDR